MCAASRKYINVLVKPTNDCNLACKYCYARSGEKKEPVMNYETLENMISKITELYDEVNFIWHGGEPLLAGLDFYEKVVELEEKYGKENNTLIGNGIQTNGTLLNEKYLEFFIENKFGIGLSIDGPREVHNLTRIYKDGTGSFDDVMRAVYLMKDHGMKVGAIATLNKLNIEYYNEIYDFYKENDIGLKLNAIIPAGRAVENDLSITPLQYANVLIKLIDRWMDDGATFDFITAREIIETSVDAYIVETDDKKFVVEPKRSTCAFSQSCQENFIGIDYNGDVYPCNRWAGIEEFKYGNINTDSLEDILNNEKRKMFLNRTKILTEKYEYCKSCEFKNKCYGGCPHNAYVVYGDILKPDPFCTAYRIAGNYVRNKLMKLLS